MSQRVGTPVNQVRHTNVATVRMKKKGKLFEIACYRNKVLSWRNKSETDLDEVLQIDNVFTNVSKGMLANSKDTLACFDTDDSKLVIKEILEKGELQITDQERSVMQENIFRDVAAIVAEKCVNPENNRPYTVGMIQNAMKQIHYGVNFTKSAKSQALDVIKKLKSAMPIARAPMALRVIFPPDRADHMREELSTIPGIIVSTLVYGEASSSSLPATEAAEQLKSTTRQDQDGASAPSSPHPAANEGSVQSCKFHADPDSYRRVQEVVSRLGSGRAYVEVLSLNAVATATASASNPTGDNDMKMSSGDAVDNARGLEEVVPLAVVADKSGGDADKEEWVVEAVEGMALNNKKKKNKKKKEKEKEKEKDKEKEKEIEMDLNVDMDTGMGKGGSEEEEGEEGELASAPCIARAGGEDRKKKTKQGKKAKRAEKEKIEQQEAERLAMKARLEQEKARQAEADTPTDPTMPAATAAVSATAPCGEARACTTCGGAFDKTAFREHFRSEWHRCNLKRRMEGASVLSESDFLAMST